MLAIDLTVDLVGLPVIIPNAPRSSERGRFHLVGSMSHSTLGRCNADTHQIKALFTGFLTEYLMRWVASRHLWTQPLRSDLAQL
jgi:hypothetical protein